MVALEACSAAWLPANDRQLIWQRRWQWAAIEEECFSNRYPYDYPVEQLTPACVQECNLSFAPTINALLC
jgi:hypothetical protein